MYTHITPYRAAGSCDVSVFTRIAAQYPELAADEKYIDHYLNLLTKDEVIQPGSY